MIRFSRKEDYSIILISKLADEYKKRLVPLSEISSEYAIPLPFLQNLAGELRKAGLIKAIEGKIGGYYLTRDPKTIKLGDIISIFTKGDLFECCPASSKTTHVRKCPKQSSCIANNMWRMLNKNLNEQIYPIHLTDLNNHKNEKI